MIEIYAQSYNGQPASADLRCVFGPDGGTFGRGSDNRLPLRRCKGHGAICRDPHHSSMALCTLLRRVL